MIEDYVNKESNNHKEIILNMEANDTKIEDEKMLNSVPSNSYDNNSTNENTNLPSIIKNYYFNEIGSPTYSNFLNDSVTDFSNNSNQIHNSSNKLWDPNDLNLKENQVKKEKNKSDRNNDDFNSIKNNNLLKSSFGLDQDSTINSRENKLKRVNPNSRKIKYTNKRNNIKNNQNHK